MISDSPSGMSKGGRLFSAMIAVEEHDEAERLVEDPPGRQPDPVEPRRNGQAEEHVEEAEQAEGRVLRDRHVGELAACRRP